MSWEAYLLFIVCALLLLLFFGMTVPLAFLTVNVIAVYIFFGPNGMGQLSLYLMNSIKKWTLLPIPLFVFMGEILFRSGIAARAINTVDLWFGKVPGRLGLVCVASATLMGTFTGSSMATSAVLTSTLLPEMEKRGYSIEMSIGPIIGAGGLALMIPPSNSAIITATLAGQPIGQVLIAIILPGILMGLMYSIYIVSRALINPDIAPKYEIDGTDLPVSLSEKLIITAKNVVPLAIIIFSVTGVIFFGITTPSEAAATGVLGSILVVFLYREFKIKIFFESLFNATKIAVMLYCIILSSVSFSYILNFSGISKNLGLWVTTLNLPPILIIISMILVVLIMGMFMETNAIKMITIPIFFPIVKLLGYNELWFLILFMICTEMSECTPPFGVLLFLVKGLLGERVSMSTVIRSAIPFVLCDSVSLILIMIFPKIVYFLPSLMK